MPELTEGEVREMLPHLQRFSLWLTRDPHSAEDLVQSCLEKALAQSKSLKNAPSLRAWLFSILYRQFIDGQRRKRRYQRILSLFTGEDTEVVSSAEEMMINDDMLAAFAQLPTEQRALLILVSVEGLSYKEVAQTLDIPLGTVMSRLSRARKQLQQWGEGSASPGVLRRLK
ncbi:RNA polymerase sigma factor [Rouxiella sp. Mn2063]|uniref:RNA polymerase sigma factor n=1 Tax=Rouxiella sp. Mn2063 TaxID=3395262 RepID=UPI003BC73176